MFYGVEPLDTVRNFDKTIFNVDRSWWYWPDLLEILASFNMTNQLLMKSHVGNKELYALASTPVKFPYIAIVRTMAEVEEVRHARRLTPSALNSLHILMETNLLTRRLYRKSVSRVVVQLNALNLSIATLVPGLGRERILLSSRAGVGQTD